MAKKRMFDKDIINTEKFLDLPMSAKALYFLLGMEADDEGFVTPKKVLRLYGGTQDDLNILILKNFVIPFNTGVVVITDWYKNNWLDGRRKASTIYQNEKNSLLLENNTYIINAKQTLSNCLASREENRREENSNSTTTIIVGTDEKVDSEEEPLMEEPLVDNIFEYLETAWGRTLSPYEYELLTTWDNDEITRYAIKESVKCNARSIKYVEAIVKNLKAKGIVTEAEAIKESDNFRVNKQKHINNYKSKTTGDKLNELEKRIMEEQNDENRSF